ncbi:hypothetical protein NTCA1_45820 [Novosphingobium sp. TCA1]|nr:hypothetical protein NTCA1_45820 [Novosphingobium sp. TCA1]
MNKEQEAGLQTVEVCRKRGLSTANFYKLDANYGGREVSNAHLDTLIYLWRCVRDCDSIELSDGGVKCRHSVAFSISTSGMQPCPRRAIRWRSWPV